MAIIVSVSELMSVANELNIDQVLVDNVINATEALAEAVAKAEGVEHHHTSNDLTGIYITFGPGPDGKTSEKLAAHDLGAGS